MLYSRNTGLNSAYYCYIDANNGNGVWHAYIANDATTEDIDSIINIGQAFGVVLSDNNLSTLTFTDKVRTHNNGLGFRKKSNVASRSFNLVVASNGMSDYVNFRINEEATSRFDGNYDAYKFNSFGDTPTPSFISSDGKKLSICQQPESESVDLGFNMAVSGQVTFSLSNVKDFTEIILEDKVENTFTDLMKDTYTFNYSDNETERGRFTIHFKQETLKEVKEITELKIYSDKNDIYFQSDKTLKNVDIILYNLSGQVVMSSHFESLKTTKIQTNLSGVYILKLVSNSGNITSKLILN
jgi:hypothetical protein